MHEFTKYFVLLAAYLTLFYASAQETQNVDTNQQGSLIYTPIPEPETNSTAPEVKQNATNPSPVLVFCRNICEICDINNRCSTNPQCVSIVQNFYEQKIAAEKILMELPPEEEAEEENEGEGEGEEGNEEENEEEEEEEDEEEEGKRKCFVEATKTAKSMKVDFSSGIENAVKQQLGPIINQNQIRILPSQAKPNLRYVLFAVDMNQVQVKDQMQSVNNAENASNADSVQSNGVLPGENIPVRETKSQDSTLPEEQIRQIPAESPVIQEQIPQNVGSFVRGIPNSDQQESYVDSQLEKVIAVDQLSVSNPEYINGNADPGFQTDDQNLEIQTNNQFDTIQSQFLSDDTAPTDNTQMQAQDQFGAMQAQFLTGDATFTDNMHMQAQDQLAGDSASTDNMQMQSISKQLIQTKPENIQIQSIAKELIQPVEEASQTIAEPATKNVPIQGIQDLPDQDIYPVVVIPLSDFEAAFNLTV